jgi:DNA-binding beta-propeller fold protein YncE
MNAFVRRHVYLAAAIALLAIFSGVAPDAELVVAAQQRDCTRPLPEPIAVFNVPSGFPIVSRDGCWLFTVSAAVPGLDAKDGIAAVRRTDAGFELNRLVPLTVPRPGGPNAPPYVGIALTNDEKLLVVSHHQRLTFLDVARLKGAGDPVLGFIESPRLSGSFGVTVSSDDKYAYAAQQRTSSVLIVDLEKVRNGSIDQSALVGVIPTAPGATTPAVSRDGRYLFTTTLQAPDVVDKPPICANKTTEGSIQIADVQRARTEPASATVGFAFPAGCGPIHLTLSPDGTRLSVASPGAVMQPAVSAKDSAVVVFDTRPIREGKPPTLVARIPVPPQVVRVADAGDRLFVAFFYLRADGPVQKPKQVMVIDTSKVAMGKAAILGTLPLLAGDIAFSADGQLLFASQEAATTLAVVDLRRVELEPPAN